MIRKFLLLTLVLFALLGLAGYTAYLLNKAPTVPALSADEAVRAGKPYVVKLHAQWCVVCMATQNVWPQIAETYSGRANLVVFDFTDEATTEASRAEAERLGLEKFFDEYAGVSGPVVVLDARTKAVTAEVSGSRDFADYRAAIDAALTAVPR
jgi:thiol-disulfide isomerase/thioredoxin